jgi:uncharacterized protein
VRLGARNTHAYPRAPRRAFTKLRPRFHEGTRIANFSFFSQFPAYRNRSRNEDVDEIGGQTIRDPIAGEVHVYGTLIGMAGGYFMKANKHAMGRRGFMGAVGGVAASAGVFAEEEAAAKSFRFMQPLRGNAEALFDYAVTQPVIDCHEHIPGSEAGYNKADIRFGNLFNPYVSNDLNSAGMPFPEGVWPAFHCIGDDWDAFEPHWNAVKFGSYARPLRIALQRFYGVDDFTRENYLELVKRINANNTPGIYDRVFREACGIEKVVRCAGDLPSADDPLLVGNLFIPMNIETSKAALEGLDAYVGEAIQDVDALVSALDLWMEKHHAQGAMQFKVRAMPVEHPNKAEAAAAFALLRKGETLPLDADTALRAYLRETHAKKAAELGVSLSIHTGVWNDFRTLRVEDIIGFIERNPDTLIDVYHLGLPSPRACIQTVKNYPNAYMNLCWAHIVGADMTVQSLHEMIDMVPMNKIFAFGGDYVLFVEKVFGHLQMARENVAIALGSRVDRNLMDMDEAKQTLRAWFYDNPKRFYRL